MSYKSARLTWTAVPVALSLALIGLVSTNGCGQKSTAPGGCEVNGDCPAGDRCVDGECKSGACSTDADCADGGGVCTNESCTLPDAGADAGIPQSCTLDSQCGPGGQCIAGECITQDAGTGIGCTTNADCPGNETCVNAQCIVSGGGTSGCASATDCATNPNGTACLSGTCGCTTPSDCPNATDVCVASQCTPGTTGADAGTIGGGGGGVGGICTSDSDCMGSPTNPVCDMSAGQCVPCTATENACPNGESCVTDTCVAGGGGGGLGGGGGSGGGGGGGGTCLPLGAGLCSALCGILSGTCDMSGNCCL
jgi:hypothetical protein